MRFILYSLLILFPILVINERAVAENLNKKCPTFQSVIALRPSATSSNFSYAIVADGMYYLIRANDKTNKNLEPTGLMPEGFQESRLITVVDKSDCNQSKYYLIAIKSFRTSGLQSIIQTSYSTLDLMNWDQKTEWSEPKPISEYPLFANDPYIRSMKQLDPEIQIETFVHTIFYWDETQTYFVVTKPFLKSPTEEVETTSLRYYSIDSQMTCGHNYSYSKSEFLSKALNSVIQGLNFCYFSQPSGLSDPLLYCIGGKSFQVNSIINQYKNGSVRSQSIGVPENLPTIDRLRVMGPLCTEEKLTAKEGSEEKERLLVRIDQIRFGVIEESTEEHTSSKLDALRIHVPMDEMVIHESTSQKSSEEGSSSSSTFIIVLICLAVFVLIMIGILVIAARRQQQIAKM